MRGVKPAIPHRRCAGYKPTVHAHEQRRIWAVNSVWITVYGACAVSFMMVMYALERRGNGFVLAFGPGCLLSSAYGFLSGAWPFGVVEVIWSAVAVRRFLRPDSGSESPAGSGTSR